MDLVIHDDLLSHKMILYVNDTVWTISQARVVSDS